jgi:hypothetical protein
MTDVYNTTADYYIIELFFSERMLHVLVALVSRATQTMDILRNVFKRREAKPVPTQTNPDAYTSDVKRSVVTKQPKGKNFLIHVRVFACNLLFNELKTDYVVLPREEHFGWKPQHSSLAVQLRQIMSR